MTTMRALPAFASLLLVGLGAIGLPPSPERAALDRVLDTLEGADRFSFVVVGDTQDDGTTGGGINDNLWPHLALDINAHGPSFALFAGDLVSGSSSLGTTQAQWADWEQATSGLNCVRYMVPGNHDMYGGQGSNAAWRNAFPWLPTSNSPAGEGGISYWFDVGNTRVVSVTTDYPSGGGLPNQSWLDGVLAASADMEHVFVFSHRPIMFSTSEATGGSGGALWQSLLAADVDAYFSGHWHRYQPDRIGAGGDTWEVVIGTGGGWQGFDPIRPYQQIPGFLLVEVDGEVATGTFYGDADGDGSHDDAFDSFEIRGAAPPATGLVASLDFEQDSLHDHAPAPLGRHFPGVMLGDAALGEGIGGSGGLHLDGDGDGLEVGRIDDYRLSLNGDLTLALFARADSLGPDLYDNLLLSYGTADYYVEDEETNFSYWWNLAPSGHQVLFWEHGNGSNVTVSSSVPFPISPGEVHHLAVTRDATAMQVRFFVDGAQLGDPVPFAQLPTSGGRGMLYVGSPPPDYVDSTTEFDGVLDEVRILNEVLDAGQISALATPAPPPPPNRHLWADGFEATTAADWVYLDGVDGWSSETIGTSGTAWVGDSSWIAPFEGEYSLVAASDGAEARGSSWRLLDEVFQPGFSYTLSVQVRQRESFTTHSGPALFLYGEGTSLGAGGEGAGALASERIPLSGELTGSWRRMECHYTATADDAGKRIGVQLYGQASVVFDDLRLEAGGPSFEVTGFASGQVASFQLSGCEPASQGLFAYSLAGPGPTPTAFGPVGLSGPIEVLLTLGADPSGTVAFGVPLPPGIGGLAVWMQAAEITASAEVWLGNPLALTVQ